VGAESELSLHRAGGFEASGGAEAHVLENG